MAVNSPNSPRQKMINLMYLVFIAMLALNVSPDLLNGFGMVEESIRLSSSIIGERNNLIMEDLMRQSRENPDRVGEHCDNALQLREMTDSLTGYIDKLKLQMVREADGKKGDPDNIKRKDNTTAASRVMLSPIDGEEKKLRGALNSYREKVTHFISDPARRDIIERSLSISSNREKSIFENLPLSAAVTILTKIENDLLTAEGDALENILKNIDQGNLFMNSLTVELIPESDIVFQGGEYRGRLVLAARDTTRVPNIYFKDQSPIIGDDGSFSIAANRVGRFPIEGYVEMKGIDGSSIKESFKSSYTVIEPIATIAPTLMNMLYAGIDNEIAISVPGVAPDDISATMSNGTIVRSGNRWSARPDKVGEDAIILVTAHTGKGVRRELAKQQFRVRALPDPAPYIKYIDNSGNQAIFKGGALAKSTLINIEEVGAAIDDGLLNVPFKVKSFRTLFFDSMGNAIPEISDGSRFSARQKEQIRRLRAGSYLYISGVNASGPDGIEREIAVMEIRIK